MGRWLLILSLGVVMLIGINLATVRSVTSGTALPRSGGAPRLHGRFINPAQPSERPSAATAAGLFARKIWTSFVRRPGAAPLAPYDPEAMARSPSLTWIGHSTFLVRMDGVTFLTDPMFSDRVGPVPVVGPRRAAPPGVPLDAIPAVDFVLLSHDHYDHADWPSIRRLAARGTRFVVPVGLGDWIRRAGGTAIELDWWQSVELDGVSIHCVPAQHFSGRTLRDGGRRLWAGWVVVGPTRRFYHAGDTGYSSDLAAIGERLGPLDLAALPIGAYRPARMMQFVHTNPEEALRIGRDVRARRIVAMHFGTFDLADEPLDEPPRRFRAEADRLGLSSDRAWILRIGETHDW